MLEDAPITTGAGDTSSRADSAPGPFAVPVSRPDTRFKVGNQVAVKHGLYAKQPEAILPAELHADLDRFVADVITDLGGAEALSTIQAGYVDKLRQVEALCQLALLHITKNGFTSKSEAMLLQAVDRWDRLAQRLGLQRLARPVNPLDAVHAAVREANQR